MGDTVGFSAAVAAVVTPITSAPLGTDQLDVDRPRRRALASQHRDRRCQHVSEAMLVGRSATLRRW
jgi:hypothetical protein